MMHVKEYIVLEKGFFENRTTLAELACLASAAARHEKDNGRPALAARAEYLSDMFHNMNQGKDND